MHSTMITAILATAASLVAADSDFKVVKRTSGTATIYHQGGAAGYCGNVNSDDAMVVSLSPVHHPGSCGRTIQITNTGAPFNDVGGQGNTITVTVADKCPGCAADNIDLSLGAWNKLTNNSPYSVAAVTWDWV